MRPPRVRLVKALRKSASRDCRTIAAASPWATIRPPFRIKTLSSGSTSSRRCVAHNTATPRSRTRLRTCARIADFDATSRPTVGSSSSSSDGRCSSARAISRRRICPPDSLRTGSRARSARPASSSSARERARASRGRCRAARRDSSRLSMTDEIEVERARLEHHAERAQRRPRLAVDRDAKDTDRAVPRVEQPRDQREQRGLAGAVQTEQRGEARLPATCRQTSSSACARSVGVADLLDFQRRRSRAVSAHVRRGR